MDKGATGEDEAGETACQVSLPLHDVKKKIMHIELARRTLTSVQRNKTELEPSVITHETKRTS